MTPDLSTAINSFKSLLGTRAITPDDDPSAFQAAQTQPWSQSCWQAAACYVLLKSTEEVSKSVGIIRETGCSFSVRSTGHNPNPGFSSAAETGIVLDLGMLKGRELSEDEGVARVGAGNRWGEVYAWLEGRGLTAVGGRDAEVGMGFLLGGGYGAVPNLYGLGVDGVVNFEVVLPDRRIINANSTENADLHRALKGGCTNFGIVTRFDIETHPLIKLQYNVKLYNRDDYININQATLDLQEAMEADPRIGMFTNYNAAFAAVGLMYAGDDTDIDIDTEKALEALDAEYFAPLTSLINVACPSTRGTLLSLANVMAHDVTITKKRYVGTLTTRCSAELYADAYRFYLEALAMLPENAILHYTIQPAGTSCIEQGEARGGNIMGLEKGAQCWWVFTCEWPEGGQDSTGGDDAAAKGAVDFMIQKVGQSARAKGQMLDYLSATFAAAGQDVLRSYGLASGRAMRETALKYDPDGLFQRQQCDGFLLRGLSG
ncbi:6-hydroxy-D-nicotine oxidase [Aspergillus aurantiobrunneus]